jgi:bifunctional non-homologous end joining protein LigD
MCVALQTCTLCANPGTNGKINCMPRERERTGSLARYKAKRDFTRTPEPAGETPSAAADQPLRFVVQRHRARRRHYDLRFEMNGVLASWAVPNGPTLDASVKRLAVHVEDHPMEYIDFEGVIPSGEYGGGDVIVWDTGTWDPHETDDPVAAVSAGELHADVFGQKLKGRLILVRSGRRGEDSDQWLLLHKHDEFAVNGWDAEDYPRSVLSGRTNDEVKADPDRICRQPRRPSSCILGPFRDRQTPSWPRSTTWAMRASGKRSAGSCG